MSFTDFAENKILNHIFRSATWTPPSSVYLALYTSSPSDAAAGTEVSGGSYARQAVSFLEATGGLVVNDINVVFANMPGVEIVAAGFMDAAVGGNLIIYNSISPRNVPAGEDLIIAVGDLRVGLD